MSLPATTTDHRPEFATADECRAWLGAAPLANAVQAQAQMLRQLNLLNRYTVPAAERLAILELLRKSLHFAQRESARRFAGKPLPLAPPEQAAYDACRSLWQAQLTGYLHCLEAVRTGDTAVQPQTALLLERALGALADAQLDHYRAGCQPPAEHWRALHELYAAAEKLGLADRAVEDTLRLGKNPCAACVVYADALLLHAASPHEMPLRQLGWLARWSRRWSLKIAIVDAPPAATHSVPLCVDLASDQPAGYRPRDGGINRWLDTTALRQSLKRRLNLLEQGAAPAEIQLGDDCTQPACGEALRQAYQRWCRGGIVRGHERRPAGGECLIVAGIEAIHYYLAGRKPFRQPGHANVDLLRREREEIATFGRVASRHLDDYSKQQGYQLNKWEVIEEWSLLDESATGFKVTHPSGHLNARLAQGQLLAVRPHDAQALLLAWLRWTLLTNDGELHAGVLMLPGRPEPVAVRGTGLSAAGEPYRPAFLLPAVAALKAPATAIIPAGWFRHERILEVFAERSHQIRLTELVGRGSDFDRVGYEALA